MALFFVIFAVFAAFAMNDTINSTVANISVNDSIVNTSINISDNLDVKQDKSFHLSKHNISSNKGKKVTLTTLENFDDEQEVIIEFEPSTNVTKWKNDLKGKKLGKYVSKKTNKSEILSLLSQTDVKKIWPNRWVNVSVNDASSIVGATTFHTVGTGTGVKACVLDTGVDLTHSMFTGHNVVTADFTGQGFFDGHGHGTHVATTLGGSDDNYTGIAPGTTLYVGKVLDSSGAGLLSWVMAGLDWCIANNVDVISMSLGATYSEEPEELLSSPEVLKVKEAVSNGIVVVIAAGNSGAGMVTTPGISLDAITIGAVTKDNVSVSFSGWDYVNGTLKPDLVAPGVDICAGWPGGYNCLTGTSMSTPVVAGLVALLVEQGVNDVKGYLINSSVDIGLDFGLAHIEFNEEIDTSLPRINSFNVDASFIDDGATFFLDANNSKKVILTVDGEVFVFNSSFDLVYDLTKTGVYDYSLIVINDNGNITRTGTFEVVNYKLIIPDFRIGVNDNILLYHKNTGAKGKIQVSISIKDVNDNYVELNENKMYNTDKTRQYSLDFTPSLPGKYKVQINIGDQIINTTLQTHTPLMAQTISQMQVKI